MFLFMWSPVDKNLSQVFISKNKLNKFSAEKKFSTYLHINYDH